MQKLHDSTNRKRLYWQAKPNTRFLAIIVYAYMRLYASNSDDENERQTEPLRNNERDFSFESNRVVCIGFWYISVLLLPFSHCKRKRTVAVMFDSIDVKKRRDSGMGKYWSIHRVYVNHATSSSPKACHRKVRTQQLDSIYFLLVLPYICFHQSQNIVGKHAKSWDRTHSMSIRTTKTCRTIRTVHAYARRRCARHQALVPRSDRRRYKFLISAIRSQCRMKFLIFFFALLFFVFNRCVNNGPMLMCAFIPFMLSERWYYNAITSFSHLFLWSYSLAPNAWWWHTMYKS